MLKSLEEGFHNCDFTAQLESGHWMREANSENSSKKADVHSAAHIPPAQWQQTQMWKRVYFFPLPV